MKPSIQTLLLTLAVTLALPAAGQQQCDSAAVSQTDKVLLRNFWTDFKTAVSTGDKNTLSSLIHFPFGCDYCQPATGRRSSKPFVRVTNAAFAQSQYRIFFTEQLLQEANKYSSSALPDFRTYYNKDKKTCVYSFAYVVVEESAKSPGRQRFFDVQNINGKFQIIATWSMP